ncbi:connector enhancer of kinase suppressor of ras 2 [Trichonephila inaurata madagascariensis]|uniref:Connector enhancer of kinase suppressor of ras 2 n=1 Tax=Trichonephila inaurata madagascariensis TaxID=2747483 RepID=A0A8X6M9P0_9ARAC|nr:connector enhancer of kinase suppressor of ras 2 [Trichonephila inaurata madagascariensis]
MAYVNVAEWNPEHVADWLRGLEDEIQPYTQFFINNKVNGCQLLTLARDDLTSLNMTKIGHQELVLEAVELLRQLHYNLTSETLQSLALKLGCKAQSLFNDLKRVCQDYADTGKKQRVSVETLSAVSDIINLVKSLISWLDRYPFVGQESYSDVRKTILKLSVELASTAQRDQFAENPHGTIKEICLKLAAQSDKVVQDFNDSLIIQPASLEVTKIKRKADDDLGIHINSLYGGIHIIENVKFQSPAYRSGKVEEGDEIIQVNYQTVVGWQIKNIICAMKEHPSEVHLTLKKRPRHPNALGQVITLWPYRIPSKKTAFRKLYKWNKGKDIRELCPRSPGTRGEANSVSEVNGSLASEKEKLFAVNKPRNKLRRRATVTGVSPTALQAPVSLEELIGSSSKRKDMVLRTISYDPNKTIDLEDVFKRDPQSSTQEDKEAKLKTDDKEKSNSAEKEEKSPKSTFLKPPQEKFNTGHLKRQEALKNSETVARAAVAVPLPSNGPPKPLRVTAPPQNASNDVEPVPQETPPSGSQSPKQKLADWVNRQKKKPEAGLLQQALTLFSSDSSSQPSSSTSKENGSPKSPKWSISGSPKVKKTSGTMFQFPFREGRPSLSELRSLKRTANSKVFSERVNSSQSEKPATSPKQNTLNKRSQMQNVQYKKPGLNTNTVNSARNPKPQPVINGETCRPHFNSKTTDNYIHPKCINYAKIPQYPCEMHESKIVSLKAKPTNNFQYASHLQPISHPSRNNMHYQRARQMNKLVTQGSSTLLRNQKSGYPAAFYSPSGRSLSFNNIAMSSDDSSSEEYEIYEELSTVSAPDCHQQESLPNDQPLFQGMDPHFTRQLAEMYNMLSQRQRFLQSQGNGSTKGHMNAANSAIIDELALRMYHALQMNHMQAQNSFQNGTSNYKVPIRPAQGTAVSAQRNVPFQNCNYNIPVKSYQAPPCQQTSHPAQKLQNFGQVSDPHILRKNAVNSVHEHPVDLPPSSNLPSRNINVFKSATSQEIHNLYTSQLSNKSSVSSPPENEKNGGYPDECSEKEHMYETIPYQKNQMRDFGSNEVIHFEKPEERTFLCPAEKEFEHDLPCKDKDPVINNISETINHISTNSYFPKDNLFCPIKENNPLKTRTFDNCSAFKQVGVNNNKNSLQGNVYSSKYIENCENDQIEDIRKIYGKNVEPAISTLMMNIPKPPTESYSASTKCSSAQTDSEYCISAIEEQSEEVSSTVTSNICLNNDDSFTTALNCTNNSITDSLGYSSSSSLNSSSSGSTISSAGSCYYYVETQIKPQFTMKLPASAAEIAEDTPLIDLRSPTLPTMGVSMLGKKRNTSSSGSEQGSNAPSRASPSVPVATHVSDVNKPSRIVTDVEHTF